MAEAKRYRKKPVVVEAILNDGGSECHGAMAEWLEDDLVGFGPEGEAVLRTLHGDVPAAVGQWVVKGSRDAWPVDSDTFEETYEAESG